MCSKEKKLATEAQFQFKCDSFSFCNLRLPFNWKTPFGYLIALLFETVAMFGVNLGSVPIGCFLLGTCWLVMAFVDDIINDISILNGYGKSMRDAWKVKPQFHFIVQNIADAKQLSV